LIQEIKCTTFVLAPVLSAVDVITLAVVAIVIIAGLYDLSRLVLIVILTWAFEAFGLAEAVKAATFISIAICAIFLVHEISVIVWIKVVFNSE